VTEPALRMRDLTMADANALQYAAPDPARDAADRYARLHGALELKAALLALMLPPGSRRAVRAFEAETAEIRPAETLLTHAQNTPGPARLPWFELLLGRMALHPLALRQELLHATRRVMGARGGSRPIDRLHWLTLRRGFGETLSATPRKPGSADVSEWLETDLIAIARYSAFLARMVPVESVDGVDNPNGAAWYATVMEPWHRGASLALEPSPSGEAALHALATLQTLAMMQRPVMARSWAIAALKHAPRQAWTDSAADALRLTCGLLDTPLPIELARHFPAIETGR
jgi:hypothetical protein